MASPLGNVEVSLEWGGDFQQTPNGDLLIINDRDNDGLATQQRIERLIMQCSTLKDASGNNVGRADDIFNPKRGANGRRVVGKMVTSELINSTYAQIAEGLAQDPGILQDPPPEINVSDGGNATLIIGPIRVTTVIGTIVTVPSRPLNVFGSNS